MEEKATNKKGIIGIVIAAFLTAGIIIAICFLASGKGIHFSSNAVWYKYDSDNILGISATVVDGRDITYIFDKDKCLFDKATVDSAFKNNLIFGCTERMVFRTDPESVTYKSNGNEVYLTFHYGYDAKMDRVGGFYFYLSDDEWITAGNTYGTIFINHYVITSRGTNLYGNEEYHSASGDNFTQIWNKDDCNEWSEVTNKHYCWDDMPLE